MPSDSSFDVVSRVDPQELDNALNQARKEIAGRFDFKHSIASIENDDKTITVLADDEMKLRNVIDIIQSKAVKRGIDLKSFDLSKEPEAATGSALSKKIPIRAATRTNGGRSSRRSRAPSSRCRRNIKTSRSASQASPRTICKRL